MSGGICLSCIASDASNIVAISPVASLISAAQAATSGLHVTVTVAPAASSPPPSSAPVASSAPASSPPAPSTVSSSSATPVSSSSRITSSTTATPASSSPSSSSSTNSTTSITSSTSPNPSQPAALSPTSQSSQHHGLGVGVIAGIVVGVVAVLLLLIAIFLLARNMQRSRRNHRLPGGGFARPSEPELEAGGAPNVTQLSHQQTMDPIMRGGGAQRFSRGPHEPMDPNFQAAGGVPPRMYRGVSQSPVPTLSPLGEAQRMDYERNSLAKPEVMGNDEGPIPLGPQHALRAHPPSLPMHSSPDVSELEGSPPQLGATLDNPAELSANADGAHYSNGKK